MGYKVVAGTDQQSTPSSRENYCRHFALKMSRIGPIAAKIQQIQISAFCQIFTTTGFDRNLTRKICKICAGPPFPAVSLRVLNLFWIGKKFLGDLVWYFPNRFSKFQTATFL